MGFLPAWQYKADACSTMLKSVVNDYIPNYKEHLDEPEWSPEQINRVSEVIKKCNQHLGGLEHFVHDSEPLIQAVLNCHIRHDGYDSADYGMMGAKLIRRPEETVPVILNRLTQVVLNHLPRDDIAPDDAKFILFEARKPGRFRSGIHVAYCIVMQNAI